MLLSSWPGIVPFGTSSFFPSFPSSRCFPVASKGKKLPYETYSCESFWSLIVLQENHYLPTHFIDSWVPFENFILFKLYFEILVNSCPSVERQFCGALFLFSSLMHFPSFRRTHLSQTCVRNCKYLWQKRGWWWRMQNKCLDTRLEKMKSRLNIRSVKRRQMFTQCKTHSLRRKTEFDL